MGAAESHRKSRNPETVQFSENLDHDAHWEVQAWELIDPEAGRYMPRRIRGSFRGRALG